MSDCPCIYTEKLDLRISQATAYRIHYHVIDDVSLIHQKSTIDVAPACHAVQLHILRQCSSRMKSLLDGILCQIIADIRFILKHSHTLLPIYL